MQIKMSLTIYTVVRLVSAIDNTGCFTAYEVTNDAPQEIRCSRYSFEFLCLP